MKKEPVLSGWGRIPIPGIELRDENLPALVRERPLTRGLGRSYGDSSLPARGDRAVAGSVLADRLISFDPSTAILRAEAGASLAEILRLFVPRGFFPPVVPGTKFVTLGGMVAADVHGKNHHRDGCFGAHVTELLVELADGSLVRCSPSVEPDLFFGSIGGMGLLGHILEVSFRMVPIPSPWILLESERIPDIESYVAALQREGERWPMTVGWIDLLSGGKSTGRGVLMKGRWATADEAPKAAPATPKRIRMPIDLPEILLSPPAIRAFNELYFRRPGATKKGIVSPEPFFWPLDFLLDWNRMYGRRGLTQYQCVIPQEAGPAGARQLVERLAARGGSSFLCVVKDCGPEGKGVLSFPMRGFSVALDLPVRDATPELVRDLNALVIELGGRVYLAKDQFTTSAEYRAMDPRVERFRLLRERYDPKRRLRSAQSERLGL